MKIFFIKTGDFEFYRKILGLDDFVPTDDFDLRNKSGYKKIIKDNKEAGLYDYYDWSVERNLEFMTPCVGSRYNKMAPFYTYYYRK